MMDHDQRFKIMLKEFFQDFLQLFFPHESELFDFSGRINWLDKEVFADPPAGERQFLDLVAQIPTRHPVVDERFTTEVDSMLSLIHTEIEYSDSVEPLRLRMYRYYEQLRRRYCIPVLPIALYLRVGLDGIGIDEYNESFNDELHTIRFRYLYVGLPALKAEEYVDGDNALGIAFCTLMKTSPENKVGLAARALKRLLKCQLNDWQTWLLFDCLIAYSGMDEKDRNELEQIMAAETNKPNFPYTRTWFDDGMEQGMRQLLKSQIEQRFGPLSDNSRQKLAAMPVEEMMELGKALLKAESLSALGLSDAHQ